MELSRDLTTQLDVLTEALGGSGDDLLTILRVLVDDLSVGISSFAGLSVTLSVDGEPVTMTAMYSPTAAASVLLPLPAGNQAGYVVVYAQNPGACNDLAADIRIALADGGQDVVVDGHLPPPTASAAHRAWPTRQTDRASIKLWGSCSGRATHRPKPGLSSPAAPQPPVSASRRSPDISC